MLMTLSIFSYAYWHISYAFSLNCFFIFFVPIVSYVFLLLMCNQNKPGKWLWHKQKSSTHHISIWPPLTPPRSLPTTLHPRSSVLMARQLQLHPALLCYSLREQTGAEAVRSLYHFSLWQITTTYSGSHYHLSASVTPHFLSVCKELFLLPQFPELLINLSYFGKKFIAYTFFWYKKNRTNSFYPFFYWCVRGR